MMVNGYSYGSMQLPDSLAPGEYKLLAYTNLLGRDSLPIAVFTQDLSIRYMRLWCGDGKAINAKTANNGTCRQDLTGLQPATATATPII